LPSNPKHTPIPTTDLRLLTEAVGRIEGRVTSIQEEQLPPVAKAATEARDGVIRLTERQKATVARVKSLEDRPSLDYQCDKSETIRSNTLAIAIATGSISAQEREIAGLSKWRWWLGGLIVTVVSITIGWALTSNGDARAAQVERQAIKGNVTRHEVHLQALEKASAADRQVFIKEVRAVPQKVQAAMPEPDIDDAVDDAHELTDGERTRIRAIIKRAERRNGKR